MLFKKRAVQPNRLCPISSEVFRCACVRVKCVHANVRFRIALGEIRIPVFSNYSSGQIRIAIAPPRTNRDPDFF